MSSADDDNVTMDSAVIIHDSKDSKEPGHDQPTQLQLQTASAATAVDAAAASVAALPPLAAASAATGNHNGHPLPAADGTDTTHSHSQNSHSSASHQSKPDEVVIPVSPALAKGSYLTLLAKLREYWLDCPDVHVQFQDLSYIVSIPVVDKGIRNFLMTGVDGIKRLFAKINPKWQAKTKKFNVLAPVSGRIAPATMTLVLAPPGHGKTTFLKALAGRLNSDRNLGGKVLYNGLTAKQAKERGVYLSRLCTYVGQGDIHFPVLTVQETLDFAAKSSNADVRLLAPGDQQLIEQDNARAELLMQMLGLEECANTIIGSELMRGVSGGQRRRVSLGEMLITNARLLLLDEVSTGLDAAVTFHIFHALQQWARLCHGSVVTSLLQPTPETYELFDDIMLLREGELIYHGPRTGVRSFFAQQLGVPIPKEADEGGFVVDYLNDPATLVDSLRRHHKLPPAKLIKRNSESQISAAGAAESSALDVSEKKVPSPKNADGFAEVELQPITPTVASGVKQGKKKKQANRKIDFTQPAISTSDMLDRYHASPYYAAMNKQIADSLDLSRNAKELQLDPALWSQFTRHQFAMEYPHSAWHYTKLDMVRQAKLTLRNKQILIPRIVQALMMGFIFGTLFFQLSDDDYASRLGLIMYCAMQGAFANLSELPVAAEARNVVTKQLDSGFFPVSSFVVSNIFWSVPKILIEAILFSTLMYWIPGFVADGGRFLYFIFVLFMTSMALGNFFRTISFATSNPDVARQLDFPFIIVFVIFGGFLIPYEKIPRWLIWLYWLNPLSWSVTSISLNEFGASKYDAPNPGETIRRGDSYLESFDLTTNYSYRFASIGYLWGFFVVFSFVCGMALRYVRSTAALGTRRIATEGDKQAKRAKKAAKSKAAGGKSKVTTVPASPANGAIAAPPSPHPQPLQNSASLNAPAKNNPNAAPENSQTAVQFGLSALPFTPVTLIWKDIRYTVKVGSGKQMHDRVLLKSISGFAKPGTMTALIGSSGAGKTTLMDVIAGRKTTGVIEGQILINGRELDPKSKAFNVLTGYVEQQDLHMGMTTVREALQFSARLRLPASVERVAREAWIDEVMGLVGLTKIAGRLVGDAAVPGLSPGQLKLLTIAVELVANPSVLFLDEPTSGLDAPSALRVMKAVRRIAQTGRSVLCTIHQPSAEIFYMFDCLLLLRSGGQDVYFGDMGEHAINVVNYFEEVSAGKAPKLPEGQNPANWMLDVIGAGVASAEGGSIQAAGFEFADYASLWRESELYREMSRRIELACVPNPEMDKLTEKLRTQEYVSAWVRYLEVQKRYFVMHWRNAPTNLTRIILLTTIGLLLGLIYLDIQTDDFQGVQSMLSVIFLGLAFPASVAAASAFPSFFRQRAVYYRESTIGMYGYIILSTGMMVVEMPYIFFALPCFMLPFYWMIGMANSGTLFWKYYLVVYVMGLTYSSLSQLWMALAPSQIASNVMNSFVMSMFFMFGGLFIKASAMPVGWRWFSYLDPIPKALIAAAAPQFFCDTSVPGNNCPKIEVTIDGGKKTFYTYDFVHDFIEGGESDYGKYIGYLILTLAVIRILIVLSLAKISHLKR